MAKNQTTGRATRMAMTGHSSFRYTISRSWHSGSSNSAHRGELGCAHGCHSFPHSLVHAPGMQHIEVGALGQPCQARPVNALL